MFLNAQTCLHPASGKQVCDYCGASRSSAFGTLAWAHSKGLGFRGLGSKNLGVVRFRDLGLRALGCDVEWQAGLKSFTPKPYTP